MRSPRTAYELARSQVATSPDIVRMFWRLAHRYRTTFSKVLDLGAGDGRFAIGGDFASYEGIEIDEEKLPIDGMPKTATLQHLCAFDHQGKGYSACIGNPPYVRHHDLNESWRDALASRLSDAIEEDLNRKCNLYIYFMVLALLKSRNDGLVATLVPYEWVTRPSAAPLRRYIRKNRWHVDTYRFTQPIFDDVLTTASISIIDKRNRDDCWRYFQIGIDGMDVELGKETGSRRSILPYQNRGEIWAMRGMSPGTQRVFTLTEGERIHAGLKLTDVLPCVTSLRGVPNRISRLSRVVFRKRFVDAGAKCWLIRSCYDEISPQLRAYLDAVPKSQRNTWTCENRDLWYKFPLFGIPQLIVSTGFTNYGPKVLVNSVGAHSIGSVCGVYGEKKLSVLRLQQYLRGIDFESRVVPHAKRLKKIEIRQLNTVLNRYTAWEARRAET